MARPPRVFVRELTGAEGARLLKMTRTAKDRVRLRRATIVLASAQGRPAPAIASLMQVSQRYVREVITAFNQQGFAALDPKWSGGRPSKTDPQTRERICQIARCCPRDLKLPFSVWSLTKLADHLAVTKTAVLSRETLRTVLRAGGVSWQATKTWKASNDPEFTAKKDRILVLYDQQAAGTLPDGDRVICVDEFGPLNLQPRPGRGWFPRRRPRRQRATFHRTQGVRHLLGALDLATGRVYYRIRDRKRGIEFLAFLKTLRARWPDGRLHLIVDNFSPHRAPAVRAWAAEHDVELVFLPTYSSWLNWIEAEFAALRYFALNGTDHRSHAEQDEAIAGYIRWRNQHTQPKRGFAVNSKIRGPEYLPYVS